MNLLRRLFRPMRTENLLIYGISKIVDGDVKTRPYGKAPRFNRAYEDRIRREQCPAEGAFLEDTIAGSPVTLLWSDGGIDAVCFIDPKAIPLFPGYTPLAPEALQQLDAGLRHFPR